MRLCMFHPSDNPMDRGWVGRIDGDRVLHLAAQTLQSLFLGGGGSREHAEYALDAVTLLAPVMYPPTVRVFEEDGSFRFANATAVVGPGVAVHGGGPLTARGRVAAVIGADGAIGGFSSLLEWRDPSRRPPVKQVDFGLVLGPTVVTPDELDPASIGCRLEGQGQRVAATAPAFSWDDARSVAASGTSLRPGDVIAGPPVVTLDVLVAGIEFEVDGVGVLACPLA